VREKIFKYKREEMLVCIRDGTCTEKKNHLDIDEKWNTQEEGEEETNKKKRFHYIYGAVAFP